jgi:hypothetical protein
MPVKWNVADMNIIRPPVEGLVGELGWAEADFRREGRVALSVLKEPSVSISRTVRKALEERPESGAMKFPAAPALFEG